MTVQVGLHTNLHDSTGKLCLNYYCEHFPNIIIVVKCLEWRVEKVGGGGGI